MKSKIIIFLFALISVIALLGCIQAPEEKPAETPSETPTITQNEEEQLAREISASMETPSELSGLEEIEVDLNELSDLASELKETGDIADSGINEDTFE